MILNDDEAAAIAFKSFYEAHGYHCTAASPVSAEKLVTSVNYDFILIDFETYNKATVVSIKTLIKLSCGNAKIKILYPLPMPHDLRSLFKNEEVTMLPRPFTAENILRNMRGHGTLFSSLVDYSEDFWRNLEASLTEFFDFYLGENCLTKFHNFIKKSPKVDKYLSTYIPLNGDERYGTVLLSLDKETAVNIATSMMGEDGDVQYSDEEILDIAGEITNQFSGILMDRLTRIGHPVSIGIPKSFFSDSSYFVHPGRTGVACINFRIGGGFMGFGSRVCRVEVCIDQVFRDEEIAS